MKKISLTQDKFALVDDIDYGFLMQWKWCFHNGYAERASRKSEGFDPPKLIYMHRVVLSRKIGYYDFEETDHKNHNRLDNRRDNLRPATCSQNRRNKKSQRGSSTFKGVSWHKRNNKWQSYIMCNRIRKHLGSFTDEIEAAKAYNKAAIKHFGEFAYLNPV